MNALKSDAVDPFFLGAPLRMRMFDMMPLYR
jgi:hypothetical protein